MNDSSGHAGAVRAASRTRVVAIDIGTYGSGFCTTSTLQPASGSQAPMRYLPPIKMHEGWPNQPVKGVKARTALLYCDRAPVAWGWEAYKKLSELSLEEQSRYMLVDNFKLALQDEDAIKRLKDRGLTPEQCMMDFLKPFSVYIKRQLRADNVSPAELDNIEWVMSVPAAWSDKSKDLMRVAAYRAGITRQRDDPALTLILEPEAAALHAKETNAPPLAPGMTVCVLDVGGGTADMTVHEVEERGGQAVLADMLWATGAMCGGAYVDKAFRAMYRERVGAEAYDRWLEEYPAESQQVNDKWLALKHGWTGRPSAPAPGTSAAHSAAALSDEDEDDAQDLDMFRVFIPPNLHRMMSPSSRATLSLEQLGTDSDILLSSEDMAQLFDTSIDGVITMAKDHLQRLPVPCSVVILVGGFAASPYLVARVEQALVADARVALKLLVPPFPYAAVMQGTAVYGCCPALIRARRTRMAYGIRQCAPYEAGAPGKFFNEEEGCFWTDGLFARMVDKGQQVERDEEVRHYVVPLDHTQTHARIQLYTTDSNETRYVTDSDPDMRGVRELVLDLPRMNVNEDLPTLCVKLKFGRAEVLATAIDLATKEEVKATFRFAPAT